jgi:hypothetical protein
MSHPKWEKPRELIQHEWHFAHCPQDELPLCFIHQGVKEVPVSKLTCNYPTIHIERKATGFTYDATLNPNTMEMSGTWKHSGVSGPFTATCQYESVCVQKESAVNVVLATKNIGNADLKWGTPPQFPIGAVLRLV